MLTSDYQLIEIILSAMATAVALFGAALVHTRSVRDGGENWLVLFLLLRAVDTLDSLLFATDWHLRLPHLIGLSAFASVLLGPSIYLYARAVTSPQRLSLTARQLALAYAPALLVLLIAIPLFLLDGPSKIDLVSGNPELQKTGSRLVQLSAISLSIVFFAVNTGYLIALARLLVRHSIRVRSLFSNIEDKTLDWLRWVWSAPEKVVRYLS